jgi:hypothetical protein
LAGDWIADAAADAVRLLSYDHPGCGSSGPQPGRTVSDCASDVRPIDHSCWDDGVAHFGDWEFGSTTSRCHRWPGRRDKFVPFQHGEWLAGNIPGVDRRNRRRAHDVVVRAA